MTFSLEASGRPPPKAASGGAPASRAAARACACTAALWGLWGLCASPQPHPFGPSAGLGVNTLAYARAPPLSRSTAWTLVPTIAPAFRSPHPVPPPSAHSLRLAGRSVGLAEPTVGALKPRPGLGSPSPSRGPRTVAGRLFHLAASLGLALGALLAWRAAGRAGGGASVGSVGPVDCGAAGWGMTGVAGSSDGGPRIEDAADAPLDDLELALELAIRNEDFDTAARLRDELRDAEAAHPMAALRRRQEQQQRALLETGLYGADLDARLAALKGLGEAATHPAPVPGAEDALHRLLREVSGADADELRAKVTEIMGIVESWKLWRRASTP